VLRSGLAAVCFVVLLWVPAPARAQPPTSAITLTAVPSHTISGQRVTLSGRISNAPPGSEVELYASRYPYPAPAPVATTQANPDGSFSFTEYPDRETRYEVRVVGTTATATIQCDVAARSIIRTNPVPLGRAKVVIVLFHPKDLRWGHGLVKWSFASGWRGRFVPGPPTRTVKLSPYVIVLHTSVTLPAGLYRWRACFRAPGDRAMADPERPSGCTGFGFHGAGHLPVGFPGPAAIARAGRYLNSRGGHTALAVVDSEGRLSGIRIHDTFITGSVVKAMLLVAYLRRLDARGQHRVDSYSNSFLYPMIHVSDNDAATQCWSIVGNGELYALANAAGMTEFSVTSDWGSAMISGADQAKFFFEMDKLIPHEFVGYARFLLSTIADYESWGIPATARPLGYAVFFKGGWRPSPDIYLVHQIARMEGHHHTFSVAVMTDGDPDMSYGIDTIQGVTTTLLR
jgi:hypothetical protein